MYRRRRWRPAPLLWLLGIVVGAVVLVKGPQTVADLGIERVVVPAPVAPATPVEPTPPLPPGAENLPQAMRVQILNAVTESATQWGLDPALIYAVIETESSWNPFAKSPAGAIGLMQVMPTTAASIGHLAFRLPTVPAGFLYDPAWNVRLGAAYLGMLTKTTSTLPLALSAYNDGDPTHVTAYASVVLQHFRTYAAWEVKEGTTTNG